MEGSNESDKRIKFPLYTTRPHNWQRDGLPRVEHDAVVDPMDVARRDYMEYFVDKILQHCGNPKKSSSMEFEDRKSVV